MDEASTPKPPPAPTSPAKAPQKPDAARSYKVRKGDSFYSIARRVYKDPGKWKKLYEHNRTRLPDPAKPASLRTGTVIELPVLASSR